MAFLRRRDPVVASVTAAARRIEVDPERRSEASFAKAEDWQRRAWEFYDGIGEAGYAANYMGNSISRLRMFVGVMPDPQGGIEPVQAEPDGDAGYTAEEVATANEALERLKSPLGGRAELQRRLGVNFFVAGDSYLIGQSAEMTKSDEEWEVYSSEQVYIDPNEKHEVKDADGTTHFVPKIELRSPGSSSNGEVLRPEAVAYRLWRPHPRYRTWADSPYRRAMNILEELDIATRATLGVLRQRLQGPGILLLPKRMLASGGVEAPNLDQDGQERRTKGFARDLIDVTSKAIEDPSTAAAQVPFIVGVQDDIWEKFDPTKHLIQWDRTPDEQTAKLRAELITRFAATIDLPPEIVTGKANVNHWTSWNIDDDTYQAHVHPFGSTIFESLTYAYLRPALAAAGLERVERFFLWFDPTDLVSDPDQADKARQAHSAYLISDQVARRDQGYTETDKPDDEEVLRRLVIDAARAGRPPVVGQLPVEEGPPPMLEPEEPAALVASAKDRALAGLGRTLATLDEGLMAEAHTRADQAMRRALERANSRLKGMALRANGDKTIRALVEPLVPEALQVGPTLGEALIVTLAGDDTTLFAEAFGAYLVWWDERVGRTQDAALNDTATAGDLTDQALAFHVAELDRDRAEGRALMGAALLGAASGLLVRPEVPGGPGERGGELVARGLVRVPLARAGGGGSDAFSLLTGERWGQVFTDALVEVTGWTWEYGDPASRHQPFDPHIALNGMFFADWSSDHLGNAGYAWPGVSHWSPGDHPGCRCSAVRSFRRVERSSSFVRPATATGGRP